MAEPKANEKRSRIYVSACDIKHRADDAKIIYNESQSVAEAVNRLVQESEDDPSRQNPLVEGHLTRLFRCLWEAAIVKILTCWKHTERYNVIIDSTKPALVIQGISNRDVGEALERLRDIRNEQIAHPIVNMNEITNLAIKRTGDTGPFIAQQFSFAASYDPPAITIEQCKDVERVIEHTIQVARRLQHSVVNGDVSKIGRIES